MAYKLGKTSLKRLEDLHEAGQKINKLAITYTKYDFGISEVLRSEEKQRENIANGVSWTMDSRHLPDINGVCYAWDIFAYIDGKANYEERYLRKIAGAQFRAAQELGYEIEWGGHWFSALDMPHFQLSRRQFPCA